MNTLFSSERLQQPIAVRVLANLSGRNFSALGQRLRHAVIFGLESYSPVTKMIKARIARVGAHKGFIIAGQHDYSGAHVAEFELAFLLTDNGVLRYREVALKRLGREFAVVAKGSEDGFNR